MEISRPVALDCQAQLSWTQLASKGLQTVKGCPEAIIVALFQAPANQIMVKTCSYAI
jgi:hypothetical protein